MFSTTNTSCGPWFDQYRANCESPELTAEDVRDRLQLDNRKQIDPAAVERLNRIIAASGASVVISSSWRILHTLEDITEWLRERGFAGNVVGATPRLYRTPEGYERVRGHEIQAYLDAAETPVEAFCILDDSTDMAHLAPWLVRTSFERGLEDHHVDRALELLR